MFSTWHGLWRFKDLTRRTASDKIFHYKAFNNAKHPKYGGYQQGLLSMLYKSSGIGIKNENISNQLPLDLAHEAKVSDPTRELAEEIHKKIIGKLKKNTLTFYRQYLGC